jgi:hypothetical protein
VGVSLKRFVPVALAIALTTVACANGSSTSPTAAPAATPIVTVVAPGSGAVGTVVTIGGGNFGSTQAASTVTFNGTPVEAMAWAATSVRVPVPAGATTGNVVVTVGGVASAGVPFTVLPTYTRTLNGTVPEAANGVPQTTSHEFSVGPGGGMVSVTLTSAVETYRNGSVNPSVVMGLAVGSPHGTTCLLPAGTTPALIQATATSPLSGLLDAGTYCVQVSDQTIQVGPVAYTVVVVSP